jgi:2-oxoglutarate ferredoxin oxidoreductase subunit alpha
LPSRKKELSIVLSGEAGQGLKTLEVIFSKIVKASGYHVFTYTEFMSRIRGGNNTTEIRVSSTPCHSFVDRIDVAIPLQKDALKRLAGRITPETLIIGEKESIDNAYRGGGYPVFEVPFHSLTEEIGGKIFLNTLVTGLLSALLGMEEETGLAVMRANLKKAGEERAKKNEEAFKRGYGEGKKICLGGKCPYSFTGGPAIDNDVLLYGSDSIGIGALAGGCNFIAAYPMSPSTAILEFMAKQAAAFGIVVEQAEDEIAAVNMAVGAWYAGARALVSTSGGGFALMVEGISLAGCIESPLVVHIGQRPGPATGLPTRTEQADLNMALYAGHGEFPRVIFAPANFQDGVDLTCEAFNCADKYQIPVFVLTDQYFLESSYTMGAIEIANCREKKYLIETAAGYKRYALTENGISPRSPARGPINSCS